MNQDAGTTGIVCLGASAGGLRSLEAVLAALPADFPWPVLVSQHLQRDRPSQLPEILSRAGKLPVHEAIDGEPLRAGAVHTCPSDRDMGVTPDGHIALRAPPAGPPQRVDHLFATAAFAKRGRIIGVVLSGTGADGAAGSLVIKLNDGVVLAESEVTAQFAGMPDAARRAGAVDATLPASEIGPLLVDLARGQLAETNEATRAIVLEIAKDIGAATGTDFAHYRHGTLRRRADNRRAIRGDATLRAYRERLAREPQERVQLVRSLLIPVTQFFRDPAAWQALEANVVPILADRARAGLPVRVWCAGCATGEEPYSLAMLLAEAIPDAAASVQILATDLDAEAIKVADEGTYDAARLAGLPTSRRERFFRAAENGHRVRDEIRRLVQFRVHDITRDASPGTFDLIVCRNLLIYFDEELQARTLRMLHDSLTDDGFLFLGRSEAIAPQLRLFAPVDRVARIFMPVGPRAPAGTTGRIAGWPAATPTDATASGDAEEWGGPSMSEARADLSATNDELQSANEELAATNEELQAANEELASLNEETLNSNQNLSSANAELESVAAFSRPAAELAAAILQTRPEAIVACDVNGRLTLFNPRAADLFALSAASVGRPLHLTGIAPGERELRDWLQRASAAPLTLDVDHEEGPLVVTIERLNARNGRATLGWLLSWRKRE